MQSGMPECGDIMVPFNHDRLVNQIFHHCGERHNTPTRKGFDKNAGPGER